MAKEPSPEVISKLEQATAAHRSTQGKKPGVFAPQPRQPKQPTVIASPASGQAPTAGNGTATYLLVDHFFGGTTGTFWAYDGTQWRAASTNEPSDEQGIAQVAYASNRVDVYWDDADTLTIARCWKYF